MRNSITGDDDREIRRLFELILEEVVVLLKRVIRGVGRKNQCAFGYGSTHRAGNGHGEQMRGRQGRGREDDVRRGTRGGEQSGR